MKVFLLNLVNLYTGQFFFATFPAKLFTLKNSTTGSGVKNILPENELIFLL